MLHTGIGPRGWLTEGLWVIPQNVRSCVGQRAEELQESRGVYNCFPLTVCLFIHSNVPGLESV